MEKAVEECNLATRDKLGVVLCLPARMKKVEKVQPRVVQAVERPDRVRDPRDYAFQQLGMQQEFLTKKIQIPNYRSRKRRSFSKSRLDSPEPST